jgi:hypothetical protein
MKKYIGIIALIGLVVLTACAKIDQGGNDTGKNTTPFPANSSNNTNTENLTAEEVEQLAENWVRNAATYKFDGTRLMLVNHKTLESYPEQHVLTYTFTSLHGGYGNRTGQMVTQALTNHTIVVRVINGTVTSAIIDDEWDEAKQVATNKGFVEMKYQPMQCQETPWDIWYKEGEINFIKVPTEQELAIAFYGIEHDAEVKEFRKVESQAVVCSACDTCPTSHYYTAKISEESIAAMEGLGWQKI